MIQPSMVFGRFAPIFRGIFGVPLFFLGWFLLAHAATDWYRGWTQYQLAQDLAQEAETTLARVVGRGPGASPGFRSLTLAYQVTGIDYAGTQEVQEGPLMSLHEVDITYDPTAPERFLVVGQRVNREFPTHGVLGGAIAVLLGALLAVDAFQRLLKLIRGTDA